MGIEQGFDVAARPAAAAGPLTLSLALSGNLAARLRNGSVLLTGRGTTLRYGNLHATDARGRVLRSWLQLVDGHVLIRVADRGATYPLRIDPLIQQGEKLTGTGGIGTGRFGYSVALSADGNTALVGGRYGINGAGAAWVFTRSGSTWTQQGGKLVGTGHAGEGEFGHIGEGEFGVSVALSADGNTALIGAPGDDGDKGAAWVFTRSGSTWTQQGEKLTGTGESGEGRFGESVALSGRRRHGADRRACRQRPHGRGLGVHALGLDLDPAGRKADRRRARPEKADSAPAWRSPNNGNTALIGGLARRRPHRRGLGVHALGLDLGPAGRKADRRGREPEKANSAKASRSPPTATRR